jgi:hypothetical protein
MPIKLRVAKTDRWSFWPCFASFTAVTVLTFIYKLPGTVSFLMIPISLFGYAIASFSILIAVVFFAVKKRPRRAASLSLVLIIPVLLWSPITWIADCLHLGLTVGFEAGQLGVSQKLNQNGFTTYDWSVGLAGGPATFLIHDVTDEIALPAAQHTHPSSSENGFEKKCAGKVRHLLSHYYVCTF